MFDLLAEIRQTLSHNRTRTSLTGLAVAWGIFMLIVLLGVSKGVRENFNEYANDPKSHTITYWGGYTTKPYKGYKEWRRIKLRDTDRSAILQRNSTFATDVTATIEFSASPISSSLNSISSGPLAANISDVNCIDNIMYGRRLNDRDMSELRRVMMLHRDNAEILFGDASKAVGQSVRCMGLSWKIIGVYTHEWDHNSYIPYHTAFALKGGAPEVNELKIYLQPLRNEKEAEEADVDIRATLAAIHEFDPTDEGSLWSWNRLADTLSSRAMLDIVNVAVWIIGIMTLISGIVGVSNIMFVSVSERTHEIGVRRAIGARPGNIVTQIILEGIAITSLFGYIGVVAGISVTELIGHLFGDDMGLGDTTVSLGIALKITLVLIICGAGAALFPAIRATKIKPVEALRDE